MSSHALGLVLDATSLVRKVEYDLVKRAAAQGARRVQLARVDAVHEPHAATLEQSQHAAALGVLCETLGARVERRCDDERRGGTTRVRHLRQRARKREIALANEQHSVGRLERHLERASCARRQCARARARRRRLRRRRRRRNRRCRVSS